ncbi:MAG: PLP-dependent aminotransferase family protein [Chloroflexaceae bacterium]|jgi:2-aminoadipate transaminase|nr:PLP-dependent aminotransferase family protein [Chloroflexaceae bacterium]
MTTTTHHRLEELFTARARTMQPLLYPSSPDNGDMISLAYGLADPALFPADDLVSATDAALRDDIDGALNYSPVDGELVEQIVTRLRSEGVEAEANNILIGYGSGQILGLLPELLVEPGDTVIIEGPSFMGAVRRFAIAGARLVTVPVDGQGLDVAALEETLRGLAREGVRPRFIYTIPTFHNPTGATLTLERRKRLVSLAAEYGVLVVEDDAYGDLRFSGQPLPHLAALDDSGWVMRVSTFSKTLAPGVRVGWAYARREIIERLAMLKLEGESGPFITRLVAKYCADGRLERHIAALTSHYRHKCNVMLEAIQREFPADVQVQAPEGGFFVWCRLPEGMSASALLPVAERHGVAFLPGTRCFANGSGDDALRLAFSYQPADKISAGIRRLGAAMRELGEAV